MRVGANTPATALHAGDQNLAEQADIAGRRDLTGDFKRIGSRRLPANDHADTARRGADCFGDRAHNSHVDGGRRRQLHLGRRNRVDFAPGGIRRQDQRRDTGGVSEARKAASAAGSDIGWPLDAADPVRHRRRQAFDVAGQRRVERQMVGGMVADNVDHRAACTPGVVHVGKAIGQARPGMQQRRGRAVGHARIAVGGTRHHAFEQAEHATHLQVCGQARQRNAFRMCPDWRSRP